MITATNRKSNERGGFTLVEVIFATLILASVFFGIFRMIASLQRTAQAETAIRQSDSVAADVRECIRYLVQNGLTGTVTVWNIYGMGLGSNRTDCHKTGPYASGAILPTTVSLEFSWQNGTGAKDYSASFIYSTGAGTDTISYNVSNGSSTQNYVYSISH